MFNEVRCNYYVMFYLDTLAIQIKKAMSQNFAF